MEKKIGLVLLVVAFFCTTSIKAQVPIEVTNGDFNQPGVKTNFDNKGSVPGWSTDGPITDSGVEAAGTAFWKGVDGSAYNLTDYIIGTGDEFTLTFDCYDIWAGADNFVATLYFDNGNGVRNILESTTFNNLTTSSQTLQLFTIATPESNGSYIGIEFDAKNNGWTGVDNVTLTKLDTCGNVELTSAVKINDGETLALNYAYALEGSTVELIPNCLDSENTNDWHWEGPNGLSIDVKDLKLTDLETTQSGTYFASYKNTCGNVFTQSFLLTVSAKENGSAFTWPSYTPTIYYDFRDEYPELEMPTKDLDDCANVAGRKSKDWWTFVWGPNRRADVTDEAIDNMLDRFNQDFDYFSNVMGWPRDHRAKNGYRSAIYLFGSGLCTDNADTTALGGWMGNINYQNENWPMVLASYFPVRAFDPAYPDDGSMGAMIHEGIHALLADLPGAKNSAWFQEGGNTWLQQEMEVQKSGKEPETMGFLNVGALIAPFMPIECYSGWLQDDSFGGPSAEGVNMGDENGQICTWRNLLGGTQYGNTFPVVFSQIFGDHSVAWLWRYCENRVLEGIADTLGDYQTRRMIMEYRAKMAMLDLGIWSKAARNTINGSFGFGIGAEWQPSWLNPAVWNATPYVRTSEDANRVLTPEYRTTPGWSGANQIPLIVNADTVSVDFQPIGRNMSCQLCYRATDGSVVYSQPVLGGECKLVLEKKAANNVVLAVITNTDYIYEGEQTRKAHFDYRLKLGDGIKERGNWNVRWYLWDTKLTNTALPTARAFFKANKTIIDMGGEVQVYRLLDQ